MSRPKNNEARWTAIRSLFDRCEALDPQARRALIAQEAADKPWLREEVESLLAGSEVPDAFLGEPLARQLAAADAAPEKFTPRRLGNYVLFHRLGRGGMAEVFLAKVRWPNGFDRIVAVKRLYDHLAGDTSLRELFELEAKLSGQLTHGNIAHTYDYGTYDGNCLLAMEYVNGPNLSDLLSRVKQSGATIPPPIALAIVAHVAGALHYAHGRRDDTTGEPLGIVHRDVSPKNILLSFDGEVKLVDFGIAKIHGRSRFTSTGQIRGTTRYLSPEAVVGRPVDARHDVFSLSACLYELLAGAPLFADEDVYAITEAIRTWKLPSPALQRLATSGELRAILATGLAPNPQDRFQTAGELAAAIAGEKLAGAEAIAEWMRPYYAAEMSERRRLLSDAPHINLAPVSRGPRRRRVVIAFAALVALVAVGAGIRARARIQFVQRTCAADAARYCPGLEWGNGMHECMISHHESLGPACAKFLQP